MDGSDEKEALLPYLEGRRASVLAILDGLEPELLMTSALPSGWRLLGMIEHLRYAERHWFQQVLTGTAEPLPWPGDQLPLQTRRSPATVFEFYRSQCEVSNAAVAALPLSTPDARASSAACWRADYRPSPRHPAQD